MNPLLDEAQQEVRRAAQEAVEVHVAPVAERIDGETSVSREVLAMLGEAGLIDSGVDSPDRLLRTTLVVEQVARKSAALASVVAAQSTALDAYAGADVDTDGIVSATRLVAVVDGDVTAADDGKLSGQASLVCAAADCDELLVVAGGDAPGLYRLASGVDGLRIEVAEGLLGMNGSGTADVSFDGAAAELIGDASAACAVADRLRVARSAIGVGIGRGALDVAVAEVAERREAGDRIDRSQSVQWMLADIATDAEAARAATWYAACTPSGPGLEEASSMCRLLSAEAAVAASRRALQIFGPRGALRSTGVERLYRDAKVLEVQGGSNEEQLTRIARHVLPDIPAGV